MTNHPPKSTSLIGKAKELEVASALIAEGIYVFFPLVDAGFDLVATDRKGTTFIPVQVKYRATESSLNLKPSDIKNLDGTNAVVAWMIGNKNQSWFVPFCHWHGKATATDRKDKLMYVTISRNKKWLATYEGKKGIRVAFAVLLE